jgi:hypothetical protein
MQSADVYLSTWLNCVGAKQLDTAIPASERAHLAASLDLPSQFGGVGLQSLIRVADEQLLEPWASITADLVAFCRSKQVSVYIKMADALDSMADHTDEQHEALPPSPCSSRDVINLNTRPCLLGIDPQV